MVRKTKEEANRTRQQIVDAARAVFHQCGVSRTTQEKVAQAAGVTRGAVYWHFKDKAELFLAVREDAFVSLRERTDSTLDPDNYANPLDAIEAALRDFYRVLEECPILRQVFEIMVLRCEYVDEFAPVLAEVNRPAVEFLAKVETAYRRAAAKGFLRHGLTPTAAARDTWAFTTGLLHLLLESEFRNELREQISEMIAAHMALRRAD
ncbi:MAG: transcriptional regulator, TetR family [Rhodocyclaceae bacterium]|nr:transcriptional regulator, TetR family [Rhodocyclaceae bacterium]